MTPIYALGLVLLPLVLAGLLSRFQGGITFLLGALLMLAVIL